MPRKKFYQNNKEKCKESRKEYYLKNKTKELAYQSKWRKTESGKKLVKLQAKRAQPKRNMYYLKSRRKVRDWLFEYKKTLRCKVCGVCDPVVLDFHHRNKNEKSKNVSRVVLSCSIQMVVKEIEKCDVLCANCHRRWHFYNGGY